MNPAETPMEGAYRNIKVALVHYWLVKMRGGEKVLEVLCDMFPEADIFTHVYDRAAMSDRIRRHKVYTTFINRLPRARRLYKRYLPLMPMALEQLDLGSYDLVISSESGPAKGVIAPASAAHLCYCHSPMRYLWNMTHEYQARAGLITRLAMPALAHYMRLWDSVSASRVDHYVANSQTVASRIWRYYGRRSDIVWPPVAIESYEVVHPSAVEDYMLMVGELVAYKRPELVIEAFNRMHAKLVVIGGGDMLDHIRRLAGPTVTVLGRRSFPELRHCYARCRAVIFPAEEDFGMVPIEAFASGRPVIAYARGGATETVVPNVSGLLFEDQSVEAIIEAVERFRFYEFDSAEIVRYSRQFSSEQFVEKMRGQINRLLNAAAPAAHSGGAVSMGRPPVPGLGDYDLPSGDTLQQAPGG